MNLNYKCCFTGYRPAKFPFALSKNNPDYVKFENSIVQGIIKLADEGCTEFYTGMAMGFDIIAAEMVMLLKKIEKFSHIRLVCVLPFENQGDSFNDYWKKKYYDILKEADEKIILNKSYHTGCYQVRNKYMVDNCDYVFTWYDGQSGGTRNTIDYAIKIGRKVLNVNDNDIDGFALQTNLEL